MLETQLARTMMKPSYYVKALWDPEASVWTSESDIPGLVIEANTLTEFEMLIWELAPEMLAVNENVSRGKVQIEFSAATRRELVIAG
jgi:hypothetical protein